MAQTLEFWMGLRRVTFNIISSAEKRFAWSVWEMGCSSICKEFLNILACFSHKSAQKTTVLTGTEARDIAILLCKCWRICDLDSDDPILNIRQRDRLSIIFL